MRETPPHIPQIRLYQNWLRDQRGLVFDDYDALWRWSTTDLDAFWQGYVTVKCGNLRLHRRSDDFPPMVG